MAKFLKIMVKWRFKKYFRIITHFPAFEIFSSVIHWWLRVCTFSTATSADSIDELGITVGLTDELGITDDNGLSGLSKTMPIFVGFFASTRLKYFNSAILKLPKNISKLYFQKWLVIFKIFINKLIWKLLHIQYTISQSFLNTCLHYSYVATVHLDYVAIN